MENTSPPDQKSQLKKIINDSHTAMMVTHGNGALHGRPMATAEVKEDLANLWFASQKDSGKVEELQSDDRVFLGYNNTSGSEWATVNGRGRIVTDRAKIKELWSPIWKNWFEGPDDPNLVLIEVEPDSAEYWDSGSKAIQMLKFAMTAVTGKKVDSGEHAKVGLS